MEELLEICYYTTLRCNFFCKHCGARRFYSSNEEMRCQDVLKKINESRYSKNCEIVVTGGEPFLKKDIGDFILGITNDKENIRHMSITTTGFFTNEIVNVASKIEDPSRIYFNISVDGLETTHNTIRGNNNAYRKTMKTIEALVSYGINVEVNTVMQKDNLEELEYLHELFQNMGERVKHTPIPLTVDTSKTDKFGFSVDDIVKIYPYIRSHNDLIHILTKGTFRIKNCHGGYRNLVIDPIGKVFPCARTAGYMDQSELRDKYCFGDLRTQSIDEIVESQCKQDVYENIIKKCPGCNANHDVNREKFFYGLKPQMNLEEVYLLLGNEKSEINEIYDFNWDDIEYDNGRAFRWMNSKNARIYLKNKGYRKVKLSYQLNIPDLDENPMLLKIVCGQNEVFQEIKKGLNEVEIDVAESELTRDVYEITLEVSRVWIPDELYQNGDKRTLGIALFNIDYC